MAEKPKALIADEDGNHTSPALESLHGVWEDYDHEKVDEAEVLRVIANVETYVKSQIEGMETTARTPGVNAHDVNRVAILDGFYDHLKGLEKMRAFFDQDDTDLVDDGFELIQEATNQMVRGFQGLIIESDLLTPKLCVQCGRENPKDFSYCRRCGAMLPMLDAPTEKRLLAVSEEDSKRGGPDGEAQTTPNFMEVADAMEAWRKASLSPDGFLEALATVRERHVAAYDEAPSDEVAQVLEANVEAIDSMSVALEDGYAAGVEQGFSELAGATIELLAAIKAAQNLSES